MHLLPSICTGVCWRQEIWSCGQDSRAMWHMQHLQLWIQGKGKLCPLCVEKEPFTTHCTHTHTHNSPLTQRAHTHAHTHPPTRQIAFHEALANMSPLSVDYRSINRSQQKGCLTTEEYPLIYPRGHVSLQANPVQLK